jgi:hypothetical protein
MHVILKLRGVIVGHAELGVRDMATGLSRGPFRPGLGWELVEPIFVLREAGAGDAMERFERARSRLAFELTTEQGRALDVDLVDVRLEKRGSGYVPLELLAHSAQPLS